MDEFCYLVLEETLIFSLKTIQLRVKYLIIKQLCKEPNFYYFRLDTFGAFFLLFHLALAIHLPLSAAGAWHKSFLLWE